MSNKKNKNEKHNKTEDKSIDINETKVEETDVSIIENTELIEYAQEKENVSTSTQDKVDDREALKEEIKLELLNEFKENKQTYKFKDIFSSKEFKISCIAFVEVLLVFMICSALNGGNYQKYNKQTNGKVIDEDALDSYGDYYNNYYNNYNNYYNSDKTVNEEDTEVYKELIPDIQDKNSKDKSNFQDSNKGTLKANSSVNSQDIV